MDEDQDLGSSILSADGVMTSVEGLNVPAIAKALATKPASLHENDGMILETENVIENLHTYIQSAPTTADALDLTLSAAVNSLIGIWKRNQDAKREQYGIGPGSNASPVTKALFLASLLLTFHHPPRQQKPLGGLRSSGGYNRVKLIPAVLLDWLREYHNQYPHEYKETLDYGPDPCAHDRFWDVIFSLALRGHLVEVATLMKKADFRHAATALEDGAEQPGYRGKQLGNVQRVVNRAIAVLDSCPAVANGNWDVKGTDWAIFRKRVTQASSDLESFAEGSSLDRHSDEDYAFEAENFGLSSVRGNDHSISTMSRRAESKVPWAIYQNLKSLYCQLLGLRTELVAAAADWVEATIAIAVWWDGEEESPIQPNFASGRRSQTRSQGPRDVDVLPRTAYQQKLSLSLQQVLAENGEAELQVNTTNLIQVGLTCIFEGDLQGLLGIVQGWSWPIATAVVEIAQRGSWLNAAPTPSRSLMAGFDKSDLMVLSFGQQSGKAVQRDEILTQYANRLYDRSRLENPRTHVIVDGWELAIDVLSRLDNAEAAENRIAELLDQLNLGIKDRIEKIMTHCFKLKLPVVARALSEVSRASCCQYS